MKKTLLEIFYPKTPPHMTVFYLYKQPQFEVLQYSVNSLKNVEYDDLYVVGDVPKWWEYDYIQLKTVDSKYWDIYSKLKAIQYVDWDECLLMNDDIFFLKPYKPISYYDGMLEDKIECKRGESVDLFRYTLDKLPDLLNHALHRPIPVKRQRFDMVMDLFDKPFSYTCAMSGGYPLQQAKDCKIIVNPTYHKFKDMDMFSTYNEGEWILPIFDELGLIE